jgi:hypothetical protein
MFRSVRRFNTLLRSFTLSALLATSVVVSTGALAGCGGDEREPQTHVDRLSDPMKKTAAVKRLLQFYEDAMTKDDKNREGKFVKPLLDLIVEPLAKIVESGELDTRSQGVLLSSLSDMRDPRAVPALVKALEAYRMDDKRAEKFDAQIGDVVRNLGIMKAKEAGPVLLKMFIDMRASWPKAQNKQFFRALAETLEKLNDKAWEGQLIKLLARPIKTLNKKQQRQVINEVYWQATAAKLLGIQRSAKAVRPLIKTVLSPFKVNVHTTSISALIKIGKPAITEGVKLLNGEDEEFNAYAEKEQLRAATDKEQKIDKKVEAAAKKAYQQYAALIVANIGRPECIDPMLAAIAKGDPKTKGIIAGELHKLPADPKLTEAFKTVWTETSMSLALPQGNAKEHLTNAVSHWFDKDLANWLGQQALELKGEDAPYVQQAALSVLMKLAGAEEWATITQLSNIEITYPKKTKIGKAFEKEIKASKAAVDKCGDKVDCWIAELTASANQKEKGQIVGIKAAYMAAVYGGEGAVGKLVEALPKITNDAVRFAAVAAIDRLSPKGSPDAAKKMLAMVDKAKAEKDAKKIKAYKPLLTVIYRLQARAQ